MNPITAQAFDAKVANLKLSEPVRAAIRAHLVDGLPVLEACATFRISTAGFYRAARAVQPAADPTKTTRMAFVVPDHRVDELRQRVAWQLAQWAEQDTNKGE